MGSLVPVITTNPISGGSVEDCVNMEKGQLTRFLSHVSKVTQRDDKLTHLSLLWGRGNVINIVLNRDLRSSLAMLCLIWNIHQGFLKRSGNQKRMWLLSRFDHHLKRQMSARDPIKLPFVKTASPARDGTQQSFLETLDFWTCSGIV